MNSFERRFQKEGRKGAWLAVREEVAEKFNQDVLCQFTYTMNGILTLLHLEWIVYKEAGYLVQNPELPILFLSGEDDPCYINNRKWRKAVNRLSNLGYEDIHAILFENMRHEIHNEVERGKVFEELDQFVKRVIEI